EILLVERRILSPDHPHIIVCLNGLGGAYKADHRFADAEKTFQETVSRSRRSMGENHPYTSLALYNLACLSAVQAKRDEAFARLRVAIDHGYDDDQHMQQDEELQSVRGDPRFDALVARARAVRQRRGVRAARVPTTKLCLSPPKSRGAQRGPPRTPGPPRGATPAPPTLPPSARAR